MSNDRADLSAHRPYPYVLYRPPVAGDTKRDVVVQSLSGPLSRAIRADDTSLPLVRVHSNLMNFYFDAAGVLDRLDARGGSIKGLIGTLPENNRKRTTALIIETLKYKPVLLDVMQASNLLKEERQKITSKNLALLLVHDLLLSRGIQAGDGPLKQAILRHKTRLHAELTKIKIKRGAKSVTDLAQASDPRADLIPRYVRVNRHRWTVEHAIRHFVGSGYDKSGDPLLHPKAFAVDEHVPDLLLFHSTTQFHLDERYKTGSIILQDKASCFPAIVLSPPAQDSAVVIDATAAPGNKTSHLSALMGNRGKLYAFERDRNRFSTLRHMLATAKCTNVEATNADFLTTDPNDPKFCDATHILLDPSCSGSGIVNRLDHLLETENENDDIQYERLAKLAGFQFTMIRHAMKFPRVEKIVYSTCSVHAVENEEVVCQALSSDEATAGGFILAPRADVLPTWHRRGLPEMMVNADDADAVIRCVPGEDHTNGFFVACFIRKESSTSGEKRTPPDTTPEKDTQLDGNRKRALDDIHVEPKTEDQEPSRKKKKRPLRRRNKVYVVGDA